ncbi:MAG: MATE family efflux transporter [Chlamydiae bacterium]|nr:MAG: MATE family efflux transporter [Chlamydiota bacterium]
MNKIAEKIIPGGKRELLKVAWPLIMSTASYSIMHFFDRVMLTRYSDTTAAAATGAGILAFALISLFLGIAGYTTTFVAQYHGSGDKNMCSRSFWHGVYFSLACGLLYPFTFRPIGLWIFDYMNHDPDVLNAEKIYFGTLAFGAIFPLTSNSISAFFSGRGKTQVIMWVTISVACINIFLNYCLIFGNLGAPELGIRGAAIATVFSSFCGMFLYVILISRKNIRTEYNIFKNMAFRWSTLKNLIKYGGPSGISFSLDIMAFSIFVLLIGHIGRVQLIASNIALSINTLSFLPMLGFSMATTILVGKYMGMGDKNSAEKSAYSGVKCATVYMTFMGILFVLMPEVFFWFFKGKGISSQMFAEIFGYGKWLLVMLAFLGVFDAVNVTFSGSLKGAGDTWFTMWISVLASWLFFAPAVYLVTDVFKAGIFWAWGCFVMYVALLALFYWIRFSIGRWKKIDIKEKPKPPPPVISEVVAEAQIIDN